MWSKVSSRSALSAAVPGASALDAGRELAATERAFLAISARSPLNLVVLVRLAGPEIHELLPVALAAVQRRHPLLRARIAGSVSRPRFEIGKADAVPPWPGPVPFRVLPGTGPETSFRLIDHELRTPFDANAGPLARMTCVSGPARASDLILTLHHAIADGTSSASLVNELLEWCRTVIAGETPPPVDPAPMPPPLMAVLPDALGERRARQRAALGFLWRQSSDEVTYRLGSRGRRRPVPAAGGAACRPLGLSPDLTDRLVAAARRRRLTLTSVLSAALLRQASATFYGGRPTVMRAVIWVDLRPHLSPPPPEDSLGCYVSMLRVVVSVDPRIGFSELASQVQERTITAARRGDRFPAALLSPSLARVQGRWAGRLGTTALSHAVPSAIHDAYGPLEVREVRGFVSNVPFGAELAAASGVTRGALWCNLLYQDSDIDEPTATRLGDGLMATLREFAEA
jgi:hypothetical protein